MDLTSESTRKLTVDQLAEATATSVEALRRWQSIGLLEGRGDAFPLRDVERVRLIRFLEQRGVDAQAVAEAGEVQGDLVGHHVDEMLGPKRAPRRGRSPADAAAVTGLEPGLLERFSVAAGLRDQSELFDEDIEAIRGLAAALDAGLPEEALLQIIRVYADALGRVADAEARLFHHYVHERLRARGLQGAELTAATDAVSQPLIGLIEPTVLYFHRKAFQDALREDLLVHLADYPKAPTQVPGEIHATILFVDLSGFTPLTEAMGDAAAADVMEQFSHLVRKAARECHGRVVKQIGDEFMLVFTDPAAAVRCGVDIDDTAASQVQFPALRLGAHAGPVLYREGDYLGANVNLAARVVAEADRHQFLVTRTVRTAAASLPGVALVPVGARDLKGVPALVELFQVRPTEARPSPSRILDPVCLMELDPATTAAQLTWHGTELSFCSDACLEQFVATPDRYPRPTPRT
jgi:class 3 adenylate cyclase/YHS domain-containing protein/DNA-binding transcriptional MerR regulator